MTAERYLKGNSVREQLCVVHLMIHGVAHWLFGRGPYRHCPHRRGANHRGRRAWRWDPL